MPRRLRDPIRKPLLGFGRTGWVMLAIALPLAICFVTGYDLRYQLLRFLNDTFGPESARFVTSTVLMGHNLNLMGYWPKQADFGLTMSVMLIAMRIHPRPFGPILYTAVIAWGVLNPFIVFLLLRSMKWLSLGPADMPDAMLITDAIRLTITIILFAVVTRWLWLTLLIAAFHTAMLIGMHDYGVTLNPTSTEVRWIPGSETLISPFFLWSWHGATYAGLLFWAIRARLQLPKPGHCIRCNYNLAGVTAPACPECGSSVIPANTALSAAVSAPASASTSLPPSPPP